MPSQETIYQLTGILASLLPVVLLSVFVVILPVVATRMLLKLLFMQALLRKTWVYIEITPSRMSNKSPEATQQLFTVLHGQYESRTIWHKLLGYDPCFSLEIVSTKANGIRYVVRVVEEDASTFERTLSSYVSEVKFRRISDYQVGMNQTTYRRVLEFRQTGHFGYPLAPQLASSEHDPVTYLTGTMSQLEDNESIILQLVVSPTRVREAEIIAARLLNNRELVHSLSKRRFLVSGNVFSLFNSALFGFADSLGAVALSSASQTAQPRAGVAQRREDIANRIKPARTLSALEQELAQVVHDKLRQPLFRVNVRVMTQMRSKGTAQERSRGIRSAFAALSGPPYQGLMARSTVPRLVLSYFHLFAFRSRLPSLTIRRAALLDASELANLYHFPNADGVITENVVQSLSRTLPAPVSLKNGTKLDVILGRNHHHGVSTDIGLTAEERQRHVYVLGGTGNGKTTMLEYAIVQDILSGKGVAVIDPHGDLAEKLLGYIPEHRIQDVIYFNPADLSFPIGLNLLEIPEGFSGDELIDAKDFITESVVSLMRKVFSSDDSGGHRIEYILRNTIQTALTVEGSTLFTVYDLLMDAKYRGTITKKLKDAKLKSFWRNEFGKAGDFQQVKMAAGVTAKIGRFQFSASAERILSQPKSTINFDEILDGKILICNFAKGLIGEDTSALFGISILAKLQLAAYRRVKLRRADRKPFYIYVDEFQNFATMSFVQLLSEARKYQVFLTMAEQTTSQQADPQMVNTILANVGTVICFRTGNPADERQLLPLFRPYIQEGEIANLPTYNFYARISAVLSQEPVSGETLMLKQLAIAMRSQEVINSSRTRYVNKSLLKTAAGNKEKVKNLSEPLQTFVKRDLETRPDD